jgi:uncharacterized protein YecT (DUF1311 family)
MEKLIMLLAFISISNLAYSANMDCSKKANTLEIVSCHQSRYVEADKKLNSVYSAAMKNIDENQKKALKQSQLAWLKFRDSNFTFVIEMNNSTNKVEGIGLIKNSPFTDKYCKVHEDGNTNRYIYIGKHFMERSKIDELNSSLLIILENCLFKGRSHSKRGSGLSLFPEKLLATEICQGMNVKLEIKNIFIQYFREKEIVNFIL